jgi:hypothetical protein
LDTLMRIAMAKIPLESLDFEDIWERWMSVKDRRFQEWFRLWVSYIFLLLLSCCPRDYHWYQYVEMSLPFQLIYSNINVSLMKKFYLFTMCVLWSHLYYSFQHRLIDKHDNVHFQQKFQYIHEGQFLR